MFAVRDIVIFAVLAGVLAAGVLAGWSWARRHGRFAVAGIATMIGFIAWNLVLNATHGSNFNVDTPVIGLSWADAGSGVLAFATTALALGLILERSERAAPVVGAAAIAGIVALLVDLFVL